MAMPGVVRAGPSFHREVMKANLPPAQAAWTAALAPLLLVAGCAALPPAPPLAPPPPRPAPASPPRASLPTSLPTPQDWRDAPITPGDWRWSRENGASVSRFGLPGQPSALELRCDVARGVVALALPAQAWAASGPASISITTSTLNRPLVADPPSGADQRLVVSLPAHDPLLDAMAFSRGRWRIEAEGRPALTVPSWPEVARVIEDCR